ncbi:hypothetical protein A0U92_10230 [Acetobacter aceti]|uniref:Uncharacterized protein n=1 Tax=Acetobacter aceti TaxID=435 RepID=A0A1U9KH09_ACEAC|nr:hypothetical protein A0U92_10230 [Acetobacter aceti]
MAKRARKKPENGYWFRRARTPLQQDVRGCHQKILFYRFLKRLPGHSGDMSAVTILFDQPRFPPDSSAPSFIRANPASDEIIPIPLTSS